MFKLGMFMLLWSTLGFVGLVFWFGEQSRQERIDSQCYFYTINGTPNSITVEGTTYKLTNDGRIDPLERPFVSPWHEEMLRGMTDGDCIFVDTKGGTP